MAAAAAAAAAAAGLAAAAGDAAADQLDGVDHGSDVEQVAQLLIDAGVDPIERAYALARHHAPARIADVLQASRRKGVANPPGFICWALDNNRSVARRPTPAGPTLSADTQRRTYSTHAGATSRDHRAHRDTPPPAPAFDAVAAVGKLDPVDLATRFAVLIGRNRPSPVKVASLTAMRDGTQPVNDIVAGQLIAVGAGLAN